MVLLRRRKSLVLVSFLIFGLLFSACGEETEINAFEPTQEINDGEEGSEVFYNTATPPANPDLRGEEFRVILFTSEMQMYSNAGKSISQSVGDGIEYFNAIGGVNGAELVLDVVALPEDANSLVDKVLSNLDHYDPVIALLAAPLNDNLYSEINQQDIPFIYFGFGIVHPSGQESEEEKLFWLVPYPEEQLEGYFSLLWKNWDEVRPSGTYNELRIAYLGEPRDLDSLKIESSLQVLSNDGFDIVVRDTVTDSPNGSATNFLLAAVQNQATAIYSNTPPTSTSVFLNDLGSLALDQAFVVGGSIWSVDAGLAELLLDEETLENYILPLHVHWWEEENNEGIQLAKKIFGEFAGTDAEQDLAYLLGLSSVDILVEVLQNSIAETSIDQLGGDEVFAQLMLLKEYAVLSGLYDVDYTKGLRAPSEMRLLQFRGGELVPVGE